MFYQMKYNCKHQMDDSLDKEDTINFGIADMDCC